MKQYDTYKDSGITWIGEIPSEWEVKKNKYLLTQMYSGGTPTASEEKFYTENGVPFVSISDMSTTEYIEVTKKSLTKYGINNKKLKILPQGTILYSIYATVGAISELMVSATISQAILALNLNNSINKQFYKYNLSAMKDYIYSQANGNTQFNLNAEKVWNFVFCFPPLSEQQSIASFLDTKCGEIDALISLQEEMISELQAYKQSVITEAVTKGLNPHAKMKDSGVEWIGEIPEGWAVCSTKHLFNLYSGATPKTDNDSFWDGNIPWITPADFKTEDVYISKGRRNITQNGVDSCGTTIVPANSVIFSKRAPIGLVVLNKEPLCTNQGCISCVPKETFSKYYYYAMSVFTDSYELYGAGTTFMEISATSFANFKLPNPSFEEQHSIATYLDEKTSQIDSLIALKQEKIQELKDYKKSIIYEYVTGKKRV